MHGVTRNSWITMSLCLGLGLFVLLRVINFPTTQGQGFGQGPGFYPKVLAWLLISFGILVPVLDFRASSLPMQKQRIAPEPQSPGKLLLVLLILGVSILAILAMPYVGFLFCGFGLILISVRLIRWSMSSDFWIQDICYAFGIMLLVYLMFEVFIGIQLPRSMFMS